MEAGVSEVQRHPQLHSELEARLWDSWDFVLVQKQNNKQTSYKTENMKNTFYFMQNCSLSFYFRGNPSTNTQGDVKSQIHPRSTQRRMCSLLARCPFGLWT